MSKATCIVPSCIRQVVRDRETKPPYKPSAYSIERTCPAARAGECPYPFHKRKARHQGDKQEISGKPEAIATRTEDKI